MNRPTPFLVNHLHHLVLTTYTNHHLAPRNFILFFSGTMPLCEHHNDAAQRKPCAKEFINTSQIAGSLRMCLCQYLLRDRRTADDYLHLIIFVKVLQFLSKYTDSQIIFVPHDQCRTGRISSLSYFDNYTASLFPNLSPPTDVQFPQDSILFPPPLQI